LHPWTTTRRPEHDASDRSKGNKRRQHLIDVFVWPGETKPELRLARDGFNLEHFAKNGMNFWLVSDLNRNELGDLAKLLAERSAL
jgi:anti-sigma factor RsiW